MVLSYVHYVLLVGDSREYIRGWQVEFTEVHINIHTCGIVACIMPC